jgi:hypothetical protein
MFGQFGNAENRGLVHREKNNTGKGEVTRERWGKRKEKVEMRKEKRTGVRYREGLPGSSFFYHFYFLFSLFLVCAYILLQK